MGSSTGHGFAPGFIAYNGSSALWMAALSLQGFLVTWILIGILDIPADRVGWIHTVIALPGLAFTLWGGMLADRMDGRRMLLRMHLLIAVPPLLLAVLSLDGRPVLAAVVASALAVSCLQALADPARSAILNRVGGTSIQRAVSLSTGIASVAGIAGYWLGGRLEDVGLVVVLLLQAATFALGALFVLRIEPVAVAPSRVRLADLVEGMQVVWRDGVLRATIGLNFISSVFNAGSWFMTYPFIIKQVYAGDAAMLSSMMAIFTAGAIISNFGLLRFMPLRHPGRLFLSMQVSRMVIVGLLWFAPGVPLLMLLTLAWGINMGVSSTMSRVIVQESAPPALRARVLSVFTISFMVSSSLSPLVLGAIIERFGALDALLPGIAISLLIWVWGHFGTPLARYTPAPAAPATPAAR